MRHFYRFPGRSFYLHGAYPKQNQRQAAVFRLQGTHCSPQFPQMHIPKQVGDPGSAAHIGSGRVTLRDFRYVALVEATTFLLLLVASVIKNTGGSEIGVQNPRPDPRPALHRLRGDGLEPA
jgi:hypothetical protein